MRGDEILLLGIGIQPPWQLVDQHLDTSTQPHELHLEVAGERGARYPCPQCGALCPAHDFSEKRWRHLNFFQHVRHEVAHSFVRDDLVFCHQYPTRPCAGGNAGVRSVWNNVVPTSGWVGNPRGEPAAASRKVAGSKGWRAWSTQVNRCRAVVKKARAKAVERHEPKGVQSGWGVVLYPYVDHGPPAES